MFDVSVFALITVGVMELLLRNQYTAKWPVPPLITALTVNDLPYGMLFEGVAVNVMEGAGSTVIVLDKELKVTGVFALSTALTVNTALPPIALLVPNIRELKVMVLGSALPDPRTIVL